MQPNPDKKLEKEVDGVKYNRYPIKTHLITKDDNINDVIKKYVMSEAQEDDVIAVSEKVVSIIQGRLFHEDEIRATWLSKVLIKFVKKWPEDPGFRNAKKMQLLINIVGVPRVLLASFVSAITKLFGVRGLFYIICGNNVSQIDGFAEGTIPPYDKYAILGPENPNKVCEELTEKFGYDFTIIDANNINVDILGINKKMSISKEDLREILLDNPIGQGVEQTPLCIIRKVNIL